MARFGTVAIVGTGLIGGSLGLAIRDRNLASRVIGISRTKESLSAARRKGAIDTGCRDITAVSRADLVVLCLPVGEIIRLAPVVAAAVRGDAVICDAGSTKLAITRAFAPLTRRFVGSHPMAGSEKKGAANARPGLFHDSLCVITPTRQTDPRALARVKDFWKHICARTAVMAPAEHDRIMSLVSHLPHAAAFALVNSVPAGLLGYSAGGFRDSTRLAASDDRVWTDIFMTNSANIASALDRYAANLRRVSAAVRHNDRAALGKILVRARTIRQKLK